jgi:hypothetical protein
MGHGVSCPRVFDFLSFSLKSLQSLPYHLNADATDELRSTLIPADFQFHDS